MQIRCALLWFVAIACPGQSLIIRLVDYSGLDAEQTARSARMTEVVLGHAGIPVKWLNCRGALATPKPAECEDDLRGNEIILRLVKLEPMPSAWSKSELGYAVAGAEGGRYASVFVPAARTRAAEWQLKLDQVLGYAMAHEAVHCLLGPKHAPSGLMRATWTRQDAREMAQQRLGLTKQESGKALARLAVAEHAAVNESAAADVRPAVEFGVRRDTETLPLRANADGCSSALFLPLVLCVCPASQDAVHPTASAPQVGVLLAISAMRRSE